MDTSTFLERVLPRDGVYVTATIKGKRCVNKFHTTSASMIQHVEVAKQNNDNIYYAISTFKKPTQRRKTNHHRTRVLALDVDCGKPDKAKSYDTQIEAAKALTEFIKSHNLPRPMIVSSGNGLHIYWVLDRDLEYGEWHGLAIGLKHAAINSGFKIDPGPAANCAGILRIIGTRNPKGDKPVQLLVDAPDTTVERMSEALNLAPQAAIPQQVPDYIHTTTTASVTNALASAPEFPPSSPAVLVAKCAQIRWMVENQDEVQEPQWYKLLGIAAHCQNPEATALQWSNKHPDFTEAGTIAKMRQWEQNTTGPTTCDSFRSDCPSRCNKCPFAGKISSPAALGVRYEKTSVDASAPDAIAKRIEPPYPFKYIKDGMGYTVDGQDLTVCPFHIYPVSYGKDEALGYEVVRFRWFRKHAGWQELVLRQAHLLPKATEFGPAIADQGIVLDSAERIGRFSWMLRSYMDKLREVTGMTNLYNSMGWKDNNREFALGNRIYRVGDDGAVTKTQISLASNGHNDSALMFDKAGTKDNWLALTNIFNVPNNNMFAQQFAVLVSLSAPLYQFTGLKGAFISLHGPTGAGKTIAQYLAQSVWGDPERLHFSAKATSNSIFNRLGFYCNLPMTIDEMTVMPDKDLGEFCYWVSQGKDKARLDSNSNEKQLRDWATPVIGSTNISMHSKLTASGMDTEAQLARLFEIEIPALPLFTKNSKIGKQIYQLATSNYGWAGPEMVEHLLKIGEHGLRAMIQHGGERMRKKFKVRFSGEERYWENILVLAYMAGEIGSEIGIVNFDYEQTMANILGNLGKIRQQIEENRHDEFSILNEYLNEFADKTIAAIYTEETGKEVVDYERLPRNDVRARVVVTRRSMKEQPYTGTVFIDRRHFRRYLAERGYDYSRFLEVMEKENILTNVGKDRQQRYQLSKDMPVKQGPVPVVAIKLNHVRLCNIIGEVEAADQEALLRRQGITLA